MAEKSDPMWSNIFRDPAEARLDAVRFLQGMPLFAELGKNEIREIERLTHRRQFQVGEVVFWEEEPGTGMYIVQSGAVAIFQDYQGPAQRELATLEAGDFFGEMALLADDPRSATAVAQAETRLLGIFHPDLFDLFRRRPPLGIKILAQLGRMLCRRLRRTNLELGRMGKENSPLPSPGSHERASR